MTIELELQAALAFVEKGDNRGALRLFEKISRKNLGSFEQCVILLNEKKCLEFLGRFEEADQRLRSIERIDQDGKFQIYPASGRIDLLFARGSYREAIDRGNEFLTRFAAELDQPEYKALDLAYNVNILICYALVSSGQYEQGIEALLRFLPSVHEEDKPEVHLFLGIAYLESDETDRAEAAFKEVLRFEHAEDKVADAHYRLGAHYLATRALASAKQHFLAAENLKHALPSNIPLRDLYMFLAETSDRLGEESECRRYLQLANKTESRMLQ
jgi:tetratricopeptide (TPR) repeat protein